MTYFYVSKCLQCVKCAYEYPMMKEVVEINKRERGLRVKKLREAIGLSRKVLGEKYKNLYGLSPGTLQSWEDCRWGGLTKNGAEKLVQAFRDEGIPDVTVEWLMEGVGPAPANLIRPFSNQSKTFIEMDKIKHELQVFHKLHENAVDMMVADDGMSPFLIPGDIVAGVKHFGSDIKYAAGSHAIIQTAEGEILIRLLEQGDIPEYYNLICVNQYTTVSKPVIENIKIFSAAPIILIRKRHRA